jgi:NADH:ubiquinone oxidoreductase subunit 6 (subunit J)
MGNKNNYAFDKINFILLAIGAIIVIIGFVLMSGSGSSESQFNEEIFSATRIKVAPVVSFFGFLFIIYAIMHKAKVVDETVETPADEKEIETKEEI